MLGDSCILHEHEGRVPIEPVPLHPVSRGGPTGGPTVPICANSARVTWDLVERIENFSAGRHYPTARQVINNLPVRYRNLFPGPERVVAYRIWLGYGDAYLRGVLDEWVEGWHPDGRARWPDYPRAEDLSRVAAWPAHLRRRLSKL